MTLLTCAAVRRRLAAYHDRELPVPELIAIEAHVKDCPPCAREQRDLQSVGEALRLADVRGHTGHLLEAAGDVLEPTVPRTQLLGMIALRPHLDGRDHAHDLLAPDLEAAAEAMMRRAAYPRRLHQILTADQ